MKILSVVTMVSPDGAFGGPIRVAVNQAMALHERGHDVTIVAGQRGYDEPPETLGGVPARLFPARRLVPRTGFAGLCAPAMLRYLRRHARSFDVAHVHVARDLVTMPAAALIRHQGVPYVLQTHGMIDESKHPLARLLDPTLTVPSLRRASAVLYLTPTERDHLQQVMGAGGPPLEHVINGVPATDLIADTTTPEVLYLARLAPRKRPQVMIEIANALTAEFPHHRFRLVGPDEGEVARLRPAMAASAADVLWEGALSQDDTLERMSKSGVYILPSVHEPYGMTVLEAMSVGLPVITTDQNGLAWVVRNSGAGIVAGTSVESLTEAVRTILSDADGARKMGEAGRRVAHGELGMAAIAEQLEQIYERSIG